MATMIEKLVTSLTKYVEELKQELLLDVRYYLLDAIGCDYLAHCLKEKVTNVF